MAKEHARQAAHSLAEENRTFKQKPSGVEQIPGPLAYPQELLPLLLLGLWAVAAGTEGASPLSGGAVAQRGAAILVLSASAATAGAAAGVCGSAARGRGRRSRGLVSTAVVHNLGQQLGAASGNVVLRLLGGLILSRATRSRGVLHLLGWVPGRSHGARALLRVQGVGSVLGVARNLSEDVADGRQTVLRLVRGDVVNVGGVGKGVGLVRNVASQRSRVLASGEGVSQRRRLNDALVGERLGRGRQDGKLCLVPAGQSRGLGGELRHGVLASGIGAVALGRLLHPLLNDHALLVSHAHTSLELLLHNRVLSNETGREAGQADLLDAQVVPSGHGPRRLRGVGARVRALVGEIQLTGPVSSVRQVRGVGFLLNDDLRRAATSRAVKESR